MKIFRQGDLVFRQVDEVAEGKPLDKLVIAEGEVTGHHHVLIAEAGSLIRGNKTKFTLTGKAKLVHPEHDTIPFSIGTYIVLTEKEHDYINNTLTELS